MKTIVLAAAAVVMTATSAFAGVNLEYYMPVYKQEPITETVQVCHKTKDHTTTGAILGGLIGSQDGNAVAGAILGGLLGDAAGGHDECRTETRTVGHRDILVGYDVTLIVDGVRTTIYVPK